MMRARGAEKYCSTHVRGSSDSVGNNVSIANVVGVDTAQTRISAQEPSELRIREWGQDHIRAGAGALVGDGVEDGGHLGGSGGAEVRFVQAVTSTFAGNVGGSNRGERFGLSVTAKERQLHFHVCSEAVITWK